MLPFSLTSFLKYLIGILFIQGVTAGVAEADVADAAGAVCDGVRADAVAG